MDLPHLPLPTSGCLIYSLDDRVCVLETSCINLCRQRVAVARGDKTSTINETSRYYVAGGHKNGSDKAFCYDCHNCTSLRTPFGHISCTLWTVCETLMRPTISKVHTPPAGPGLSTLFSHKSTDHKIVSTDHKIVSTDHKNCINIS